MIGIPDEEGWTTTLIVQSTRSWDAVQKNIYEALQTGVYRLELKRRGRGLVSDEDVRRRHYDPGVGEGMAAETWANELSL